jgi:hypothetical protein
MEAQISIMTSDLETLNTSQIVVSLEGVACQAAQEQSSPISMDQATREEDQELQQVLSLFKQATSLPLSGFVLQTPQHKTPILYDQPPAENEEGTYKRKSPRLR